MLLSTRFHAIRALKYLPAKLLQPLLAPHADALRQIGLEVSRIDAERLLAVRDSLPEALVALACDLYTLSGVRARWGLRAAAARLQLELPDGEIPIVAAAHALLERPELRTELLVGSATDDMTRFRELVGRRESARPVVLDEANQHLKTLFLAKAIAPHCQLQLCEEGHLKHFTIRYAPWKTAEYEMCGERVSTRDKWLVVSEEVVYDARTGRLRLGAHDAEMRALYSDFFGELLFGRSDWFSRSPIVHLEPLEQPSRELLQPTRGLRLVRFCGVELDCEGRNANQLSVAGEDVSALLQSIRRLPGLACRGLLASPSSPIPSVPGSTSRYAPQTSSPPRGPTRSLLDSSSKNAACCLVDAVC